MQVLDSRTLNRALLTRQLLVERATLPVLDAVQHLVALQAQEPLEPYVGLWSRLQGFEPADLGVLLQDRRAVRTLLMRRTLHLVSATDCLDLRPVHQRMLVARTHGTLRPRLPGVDLDELAALAAPHFVDQPHRTVDVARLIGDRWPDVAARDLSDALGTVVPLVQVPPRGIWGRTAAARCRTVDSWLGTAPAASDDDVLDDLVLRYLRAFGPASSSDVRAWSGLTGLPTVIARLRPQLTTFRDERGRELLDVPGAPLPDPDLAVPVRFLPAFDNLVLAFDDRSRVIDAAHRGLSVTGARFVLVDGRVAATWTTEQDGPVTVTVDPLRTLGRVERDEVLEEGTLLATFLGDGLRGRATLR